MSLFRRERKSTVVWGVWSGAYSDRTLWAIFPTKELALQYCDDRGPRYDDGWDIEPEDVYTERAQWLADLAIERERHSYDTAAAKIRTEQWQRAREEAARERQEKERKIRSVVPTPHRPTLAQMDAERGRQQHGRHIDPTQTFLVRDDERGLHE